MTNAQKTILFLGLVVIIALSLRPPYQWENTKYLINPESNVPHRAGTTTENAGHHWIWAPPKGAEKEDYGERSVRTAIMDLQRLGIYVGLAALTSLCLAYISRPKS
jgi:hypothetical protein